MTEIHVRKRTYEGMRESTVKVETHVSPERDHLHDLPQLLFGLTKGQGTNPG